MAIIDMTMPRLGESVIECTIISILKKVGETVEADDSVLEVATDKVDTEVPSSVSGVISQILVKEGDTIAIGSVIMKIETNKDSEVAIPTEIAPVVAPSNGMAAIEQLTQTLVQQPTFVSSHKFYSPLVQTIAKAEGISIEELNQMVGTGAEGRITKNDILGYVKHRTSSRTGSPDPTSNIEIIPMDRMRKLIAERMIESQRISAHVSSYVECDMTNVVRWRESIKGSFKQKTGETLTYTPIFIEAIAKAIADFPMINISVEGNNIIKKNEINVGMAVALPSGNLIVPVIKNANKLDLVQLTKAVNDLASRGRDNKLTADDLDGGTYTMSNIGTFGNLMGTPVIMQPQVAIMAFGAIQKRPVVIETPQGDVIGIRPMMYLSHSYDHRVVDGALGGMFVKRVAEYLEKFDSNRSL
jgi:2-oxoglutarate dehydrogenase E2 component (dihydrolipoamide succinyltransferase)